MLQSFLSLAETVWNQAICLCTGFRVEKAESDQFLADGALDVLPIMLSAQAKMNYVSLRLLTIREEAICAVAMATVHQRWDTSQI